MTGARAGADAHLVRRASVRVALSLTVAAAVLVIAVLVATFAFVRTQVPVDSLFDPDSHHETVDIVGADLLVGGIIIGAVAVVVAGALALLATRRAVDPLVDALARQRRFVADASHELRTPLATLDARLQQLQRSLPPDDAHAPVVAQLRADSHSLIAVMDDLLASADAARPGGTVPVEVAPVVTAAVSSIRVLAAEHDVRVQAQECSPGIRVALPEARLARALVALVDNAVKHSPAGESVIVGCTATRLRVRITVADHGAGIRGIAPEHVFDRFAHARTAVHDGGRPGYGIGLSLVRDTAEQFGGRVEVTATSAAGTTMTLTLPRVGRRR